MSDANEVIRSKIAKTRTQIEAAEAAIASLRAKLEAYNELLDEIALEPSGNKTSPIDLSALSDAVLGKYAGVGLSPAVRDALRFFQSGATPAQVRDYLLKNGYKPQGANFHTSVTTALIRMVGKGVNKVESDGKRSIYVLSAAQPAAA